MCSKVFLHARFLSFPRFRRVGIAGGKEILQRYILWGVCWLLLYTCIGKKGGTTPIALALRKQRRKTMQGPRPWKQLHAAA